MHNIFSAGAPNSLIYQLRGVLKNISLPMNNRMKYFVNETKFSADPVFLRSGSTHLFASDYLDLFYFTTVSCSQSKCQLERTK